MASIRNYVKGLQNQIVYDLEKSAVDYLELGLKEFHKRKGSDHLHFQVAAGNLSIAIELMIKACLARKNLSLIYEKLSPELQFLLTFPEKLPKDFNWRKYDIEIRSGLL